MASKRFGNLELPSGSSHKLTATNQPYMMWSLNRNSKRDNTSRARSLMLRVEGLYSKIAGALASKDWDCNPQHPKTQ